MFKCLNVPIWNLATKTLKHNTFLVACDMVQ